MNMGSLIFDSYGVGLATRGLMIVYWSAVHARTARGKVHEISEPLVGNYWELYIKL